MSKKPVLFKIKFEGDKGLLKVPNEYSAFPEEEEILVQDGLEYRVANVSSK